MIEVCPRDDLKTFYLPEADGQSVLIDIQTHSNFHEINLFIYLFDLLNHFIHKITALPWFSLKRKKLSW